MPRLLDTGHQDPQRLRLRRLCRPGLRTGAAGGAKVFLFRHVESPHQGGSRKAEPCGVQRSGADLVSLFYRLAAVACGIHVSILEAASFE